MHALERLLQDDLDRLIDRLAATTREGLFAECGERRPDRVARLDEAEARLSTIRLELLSRYAAWVRALDECADLWALTELSNEAAPPSLRAA